MSEKIEFESRIYQLSQTRGIPLPSEIGEFHQTYRVVLEPVEDLKPCPWCGGEAVIAQMAERDFFGRCLDCRARHPEVMETRQAAIRAWNQRAGNA